MTPRIPFVTLPELVLLPSGALGADGPALSIKPFGVLVALGVFVGSWLALRYGGRRGLPAKDLGSFVVWVVIAGFVGGHVLDVVFYSPDRLRADPWLLLRLWDGLSSFGGFTGAAAGALLWGARRGARVLPHADVVASALPVGWLFGRAGCAVVHDHPGELSDAWFAVQYPGGGRLDLGLLELVLVVPIALAFLILQRRAWPWGFFIATLSLTYAPVRFWLDYHRVRDPARILGHWVTPDVRYVGLTPAQWACLALFAFGAVLLVRVNASRESPSAYAPPRSDSDAQGGWRDPRGEG